MDTAISGMGHMNLLIIRELGAFDIRDYEALSSGKRPHVIYRITRRYTSEMITFLLLVNPTLFITDVTIDLCYGLNSS